MALQELRYGRFRMPRQRDLSYEEVADTVNEGWVIRYERDGIPIRDILAYRVFMDRFAQSSQLEIIINQIYIFDNERENWTRWKHRYCRMDKNFTRNLYNSLICIKNNIVWERGAPPVDRLTFYRLKVCWEVEENSKAQCCYHSVLLRVVQSRRARRDETPNRQR